MERTSSFGYWLRRRRKALDMTQAELAQRVGCSLDLVQKIEADARRPSRQIAEKLADCLSLDAAERAAFLHAARAERAVDTLGLPTQPVELSAALPQGTVTFLLTDIEGSTQLWERHTQAMSSVVARHDAVLAAIIAEHGGVVFKTLGDGMLAVFARASDALGAAVAAQHALHAEEWELPAPLRVRMALHSGSAEIRAGDYFGPTLNRASRLLMAGHGGQVLLSLATEELVRERLPQDVALLDLGTHRLRDLSQPERIFQLVVNDLPASFPPLHTLDHRHTNLPAQLTALLGREDVIATVRALLAQLNVRLVTLSGPGGVGKTRLALQVAAELLDQYADGVYLVDLAPVRAPDLVLMAIAHTLGVREVGAHTLLSTLKASLREKQQLLVLDNFEQVLEAGPLVAELLAAAPRLKVLVTSREALHLRGEKEITVAPLALPERAALPPLDQLSQYAAVALFIQRARDVQPAFELTQANAAAVAEICVRLDGLPLAIELAAARVKLLSPVALLAQLSNRLALLSSGARDLPARQQTIRNTIGWSYNLLNEAEQAVFRRLGVFVGGCTLDAINAVCVAAHDQPHDLLEHVAALVDKSLLRHVSTEDGGVRFFMLETIREFAVELLETSDEAKHAHLLHARYYLAMSEWAEDERDDAWTKRMDPEYDNLRAALARSQVGEHDPEQAIRLVNALRGLWYHRGVRHEAIAEMERALNHPRGIEPSEAHAYARVALAEFLGLTGNYVAAKAQYELALPLAQSHGGWLAAWIPCRLGWLARERGDSPTAWAQLGEGLRLYREAGDIGGVAWALTTLAEVAILDEDAARAEAMLLEARSLWPEAEADPLWVGWTLNHLGHVAQLRGDFTSAAQFHHESLPLFRGFGEQNFGLPWAYQSLGETALGVHRLEEAATWLRQGLLASQVLSDQATISWCLAGLGSVAALDEEPERAVRLWAAAEKLRQTIGCRPAPAARATYEQAQALARAELGDAAWAEAWAAGRAMSQEEAIAEALGETG